MSLLGWALIFLVVAIIAAAFGFGGIASASAGIAKVLFFIFLVVFVVLLIIGLVGRPASVQGTVPEDHTAGATPCVKGRRRRQEHRG